MKNLDTVPLGCIGNKKNELKLLLPIIEPQITTSSIFVEPFCGSSIVSFNVFKKIIFLDPKQDVFYGAFSFFFR